MVDPRDLYELAAELPVLERPVLIHALPGFVDAGAAGRLAGEHLLETLEHRVVATFDTDQLIDYRGRRPMMTFVEDHWDSYAGHTLALYAVTDEAGQQFLFLGGPEPDYQWERFTAAVVSLIDRFDVRLTVGVNSIPMAVPHTRPTGLTAHSTRPELVAGYPPWIGTVAVPGSAAALLEFRLGETGRDAIGFAAHVPHYLTETEYHEAADALLQAVGQVGGLALPRTALQVAAGRTRERIDAQLRRSDDVAAGVRALEQQYDQFAAPGRNLLTAGQETMPTADELGAEFEAFLAEQQDPE